MATLLTTLYGNTVTAGSRQFRVVAEIYSTQESASSGHYLQAKYYVQVIVGQSSAFTSYFKVSWNSGVDYALSTAGNYAIKTVDLGWVNYGSSKTISIYGQYEGGSGTIYKSSLSSTYTVPVTNITISFNANGGSNAPSAVTGTPGSIKIPTSVPTRTGYTFDGWTARATRIGSTKSPGMAVTYNQTYLKRFRITRVDASTFEILAYVENASSVQVPTWSTYDNQDDIQWYELHTTDGPWTREGITYNWGRRISVLDHVRIGGTEDLTNFNSHFYVKNSSGTSVAQYCPSSPYYDVEFLAGENYPYKFGVTLYAQWKLNTYTISYNANGGSGAPSSQTKTHGTTLKLSSTVPTKSGYTFLGWSTSSTATTATYSAGGNYVDNKSATLYAVWAVIDTSTLQTIMARYQQPDGSYTDYSQVYSAALKKGATCSWSLTETDEYEAASVSYTVGSTATTKYVTVYRKQYTISFNANGGLCAPRMQSFFYDSNFSLTSRRPTRSGYTFLGWSKTSTATEATYDAGQLYDSRDTSNPTLYAVWSKRQQEIYLHKTGTVTACEYIETDSLGFNKIGEVRAQTFTEVSTESTILIGLNFTVTEISET